MIVTQVFDNESIQGGVKLAYSSVLEAYIDIPFTKVRPVN